MLVLSNASDSLQPLGATVESCCAQVCGQVVQTRREPCALTGDTAVETACTLRPQWLLPAEMLYTACVRKIFPPCAKPSLTGELSTPGS